MKTIVIQNADRNVSARDYTEGVLAVTSIFYTIQGEGPLSGRPSMFVRLAGCNYGSKTDFCQWCDTSFQLDQALHLTPQELLERVLNTHGYTPNVCLVITGGEPTLQTTLLDFIVKARVGNHFADIQIETNGTQPKFFLEAANRGMRPSDFLTVVSPKANERLRRYPPLHADVQWWATDLKYVVSAEPESAHHTIPDFALTLPTKRVWVSPMTVYKKAYSGEVSSVWDSELVNQQATATNYSYAAQYALQHGLRLSLQTHTFTAIP